jgi:putative ABC transport system permease protein
VVGRALDIDGRPVVVVGVMDARFAPPEVLVGRHVDVWRPVDWSVEELNRDDTYVLEIAGRMRPGVGAEAVQAEVDALMARLAEASESYRNRRDAAPREVPVLSLADKTVRSVRTGLGLLLGAVGLLLLVACANVAHLFLARGLGRTREMAVRRAMGAGTRSLVSQLMVESLVVGVAGGLLGCGLAWTGIRAFIALNPTALPRQASVSIDPRVLGFAIAVSAATSLLFGLLPALRSVKTELADELRGAGRTSTSGRGTALLRNTLVTAEVALSLVLVAGAGLLLRSFLAVRAQDPGFDVADMWTVPLNLTEADTPEKWIDTMERIRRQAVAVPGVQSAAYGLTMPMDRTGGSRCCWGSALEVAGRAKDDRALGAMIHPVSLEYFGMLGIELVAGRTWDAGEVRAEPWPLVLNDSMAIEVAGTPAAAVGMTVRFQDHEASIVGVARSERHYGLDQTMGKAVYLPVERVPFGLPIASLGVRASAAVSASMPRALREAVWAAAPSLPVTTVRPLAETIRQSTAGRRFDSVIFGAFAAVALLLAAGGLYGTLLYVAGQRRRELGIRLALGASRASIEGRVLRGGVALGIAGTGIGLFGAWLSNRYLESRVWGVATHDPVALGGAAAVLLLTAILASWLPARRAGRVDPLETLRIE